MGESQRARHAARPDGSSPDGDQIILRALHALHGLCSIMAQELQDASATPSQGSNGVWRRSLRNTFRALSDWGDEIEKRHFDGDFGASARNAVEQHRNLISQASRIGGELSSAAFQLVEEAAGRNHQPEPYLEEIPEAFFCAEPRLPEQRLQVAAVTSEGPSIMGEPGAIWERLSHAGWDEVALAGVTDLTWDQLLELWQPVLGRLSFAEELELRSVLARADLRQSLSNRAFAQQPVSFFKDDAWDRRYGSSGIWSKERDRVIQMLAAALNVSGLWRPDPEDEGRPLHALASQRFAMGRRLGTLRQHVRNISKMSQFCMVSFGCGWFRRPMDFYDLIGSRLAEPCGKHVPRCLLNSLIFAEQAAEVPEEFRLSKNSGIRNFLKEVESAGGWKTGKITRKAQPYSMVLLLSLEDAVMRTDLPPYSRWYAWVKLLKVWSALRWSDVQGIPNEFLKLRADGVLEGRITRSKTSGQGKKVEVKPECFRRAFVKYQDAVVMSRALFLALRVDVGQAGAEALEGAAPLLTPMATGFWTEHSERGTMATFMQMAQIGPEVRKMVGRWSFTQEEEYLRHLEVSVVTAQAQVAAMLKRWEPQQRVLDEQIIASLGIYLKERDVEDEEVEKLAQNLALPQDESGYGNSLDQLSGMQRLQSLNEVASDRATSPLLSPTSALLADPAEADQTEDEGEGEGEPMVETNGTFVFSVWGSCNRRTLHRVGECWRVPGVHYRNYISAGDERPPLLAGDRECRDCFSRRFSLAAAQEEELAMTSSSSSQEDE
eukprot:s1179_g28.t1